MCCTLVSALAQRAMPHLGLSAALLQPAYCSSAAHPAQPTNTSVFGPSAQSVRVRSSKLLTTSTHVLLRHSMHVLACLHKCACDNPHTYIHNHVLVFYLCTYFARRDPGRRGCGGWVQKRHPRSRVCIYLSGLLTSSIRFRTSFFRT